MPGFSPASLGYGYCGVSSILNIFLQLKWYFPIFFGLPFVLAAVFLLINDYTIIPSFLLNTNGLYRTFLRNIIHPVYYATLVIIIRYGISYSVPFY